MLLNPKIEIIDLYLEFIYLYYPHQWFYADYTILSEDDIPHLTVEGVVFTDRHKGMCCPNGEHNMIYLRESILNNSMEGLFLLAHEYEHNIQFSEERLIKIGNGYKWEGQIFSEFVDRNIQPWEVDAKKTSFDRIVNFLEWKKNEVRTDI